MVPSPSASPAAFVDPRSLPTQRCPHRCLHLGLVGEYSWAARAHVRVYGQVDSLTCPSIYGSFCGHLMDIWVYSPVGPISSQSVWSQPGVADVAPGWVLAPTPVLNIPLLTPDGPLLPVSPNPNPWRYSGGVESGNRESWSLTQEPGIPNSVPDSEGAEDRRPGVRGTGGCGTAGARGARSRGQGEPGARVGGRQGLGWGCRGQGLGDQDQDSGRVGVRRNRDGARLGNQDDGVMGCRLPVTHLTIKAKPGLGPCLPSLNHPLAARLAGDHCLPL